MNGMIGIWGLGFIFVYKVVPKILAMVDEAGKPKFVRRTVDYGKAEQLYEISCGAYTMPKDRRK